MKSIAEVKHEELTEGQSLVSNTHTRLVQPADVGVAFYVLLSLVN